MHPIQKAFALATMDVILGKTAEELSPVTLGEFTVPRLGVSFLYASLTSPEQSEIKKSSIKMERQGRDLLPLVNDELMMQKVIVKAVDKDTRSDFTFANKALLDKLTKDNEAKGLPAVITAEQAVAAILKPGEIADMAVAIQGDSGYGGQNDDKLAEQVKNS